MGCDSKHFASGARVTDDKKRRIVFHFAGSEDTVTLEGVKWAYEQSAKTNIAKWQIFWDDGRITHGVNLDNVTYFEVVDDE